MAPQPRSSATTCISESSIIHKHLTTGGSTRPNTHTQTLKSWNKLHLDQYKTKPPHGVTIIDPLEFVERLQNHVSMLDAVTQLQISLKNATVGFPNQVVVNQTNIKALDLDMSFPVNVEPLYADGTASFTWFSTLRGWENVEQEQP